MNYCILKRAFILMPYITSILLLSIVILISSCVGTVEDNATPKSISVVGKSQLIFSGVDDSPSGSGTVSHNKVWIRFKPAEGGTGNFVYRAFVNGRDIANSSLPASDILLDHEGFVIMVVDGLKFNTTNIIRVRVYDAGLDKLDNNTKVASPKTAASFLPDFSGINSVENLAGIDSLDQLKILWSPAAIPIVTVGNPFSAEHKVNGYNVYYSTKQSELRTILTLPDQHNIAIDQYPNSKVDSVPFSSSTGEYIIKNLSPGVTYYIAIRARQSSSTPKYERNQKVVKGTTLSSAPLEFSGTQTATVPSNVNAFGQFDVTWIPCSGCSHYRVYRIPKNLGIFSVDLALHSSYRATLNGGTDDTNPSSVGASYDGLPTETYRVFTLACKDLACTEHKGSTISKEVTMEPPVTPYIGSDPDTQLELISPPGISALTSINLEFDFDLGKGHFDEYRIFQLLLPSSVIDDPSNTFSLADLSDSGKFYKLATTLAGLAEGVPYIDTSNTSSNSNPKQIRVGHLKTDQKYCFLALPFIVSPSEITLPPDKWHKIQCVTPVYEAPQFGVTSTRPICVENSETSTSVQISWTAPTGGVFDSYEIYVQKKDASIPFEFDTINSTAGAWDDHCTLNETCTYKLKAIVPLTTGGQLTSTVLTLNNLLPATDYIIGVNTLLTLVSNNQTTQFRSRSPAKEFSLTECTTTAPTIEHQGWRDIFAVGPKTYGHNSDIATFTRTSMLGDTIGEIFDYRDFKIYENDTFYSTFNTLGVSYHGIVRLSWADFKLSSSGISFSDLDLSAPGDTPDPSIGYQVKRISYATLKTILTTQSDTEIETIMFDTDDSIWDNPQVTTLRIGQATHLGRNVFASNLDNTTNGDRDSLLLPLSQGGESITGYDNEKRFTLVDYLPAGSAGKLFYYKVSAFTGGSILKFEAPTEAGNVIKIYTPPNNMALAHPWMVNMNVCGTFGRGVSNKCDLVNNADASKCSDPQNGYRCHYNGLLHVEVGGTKYYDFKQLVGHLLVDRFEAGCNSSNPDVTSNTGSGAYASPGGRCLDDNSSGNGIDERYSNAAYLRPMTKIAPFDMYDVCESASVPKFDGSINTVNKRLLRRKEQYPLFHMNYTFSHENVEDIIQYNLAGITNDCNATEKGDTTNNPLYTLNAGGDGTDDYSPLLTGSGKWPDAQMTADYSSSMCQTYYGVQDLYSNVSEIISDTLELGTQVWNELGTSDISNPLVSTIPIVFDNNFAQASNGANELKNANYISPTLGVGLMCNISTCANDDLLLGTSNATPAPPYLKTAQNFIYGDEFYLDTNQVTPKSISTGGAYRNHSRFGYGALRIANNYDIQFSIVDRGGFRCGYSYPD